MNKSEYLGLQKAAREYDTSVRSLYRLREKGKLRFFKLEGRTLIRRAELESCITEDIPQLPKTKIQKSFV